MRKESQLGTLRDSQPWDAGGHTLHATARWYVTLGCSGTLGGWCLPRTLTAAIHTTAYIVCTHIHGAIRVSTYKSI